MDYVTQANSAMTILYMRSQVLRTRDVELLSFSIPVINVGNAVRVTCALLCGAVRYVQCRVSARN